MRELEGKATINIDVIGIGASPYDTLKANRINVNGVNVAEASEETDRTEKFGFANKRGDFLSDYLSLCTDESGRFIGSPFSP